MTQGLSFETVSGLSPVQIEGWNLGLSLEQLSVDNFRNVTLDGIYTLMERGMSLSDAYQRLQGLECAQIRGVLSGISSNHVRGLNISQVDGVLLGLSIDQVRVDDFTGSTLRGIRRLMGRGMLLDDAYTLLAGLSEVQVEAVLSGLSREQVCGLDIFQIDGIRLGLSTEQVRVSDFGHDTLRGIRRLIENGMSIGDAYDLLEGLTAGQVEAVLSGLSREQVFGLNIFQIHGIRLGLSSEQVRVSDFGHAALSGIRRLIDSGISLRDAYERVLGIEEDQTDAPTLRRFT
tara:strand:- start:6358 stop:7221 length:864 start_codon:yes stop_codon:yes gene_type:complete